MYRFSKLIHLFFYALLVGFMAVVQWTLVPAQNHLPASAYATLEQGMNRVLTTLTPTLMIASLLGGLLTIFLAYRQQNAKWLYYLGGSLALIVMIVSTLIINAPVNTAIDTWNAAAPPTNWQTLRNHWELGHSIRAYVGLAGLLLSMIVIWERNPGAPFRPAGS